MFVLRPLGIRIPSGITDVESFRRWARSDGFPSEGRIDYLAGEVEIDVSPEDVTTHGTPKVAISARLQVLVVEDLGVGMVLSDRSRISCPQAELSAEPDVIVVLDESLRAGRVRLVPKKGKKKGRFVEIEGPADIVVECVSDESVGKDTQKLHELYHRAGVPEYWLVDARRPEIVFRIHRFTAAGYELVAPDDEGRVRSPVLGRSFRLVRFERVAGVALYRLEGRR